MLTALRLGNFKAFAETQQIPIRPLTLIFGANSSGKSSLIHGLLLARHALETGELDVHRTAIGGDSVDLGGFRQYVHRRDAARRVEWVAEIDVAELQGRVAELLAPVHRVNVLLSIGIVLDDKGEPIGDAMPMVMSYEIEADGVSLLRMSRRRDDRLQLDRLEHEHPVFRKVIESIVETSTTTDVTPADVKGVDEAIAELVPKITARAENFLPSGVFCRTMALPIRRVDRKYYLSDEVRISFPRILNELIQGLHQAVSGELFRLRYLGPLRSYPPRHLAFSQHHDTNWVAGGGYAWDVVRRDEKVRAAVNVWLGSPERLQTPYELVVRELVGVEQLEGPIWQGLEEISESGLDLEPDYDDEPTPVGVYPVIKDFEAEVARLQELIQSANIDRLQELILIDRRSDTIVSHRDVGIGISQVLPVLVLAYASENQIVTIEQPEIHLHPGLQAELGDVFIESALGERRNTFILETHSEHLILRLLRRIRETTDGELPDGLLPITPDDIAVIYAKPDAKGAKLIELRVTEDGDFADKWPDGFFTEREDELF